MQSILCQKEVIIGYFYPNFNSNQPSTFSKGIIKSVLSPRNWGLSTNRATPLIKVGNETHSFNYWDYVKHLKGLFYMQSQIKTYMVF